MQYHYNCSADAFLWKNLLYPDPWERAPVLSLMSLWWWWENVQTNYTLLNEQVPFLTRWSKEPMLLYLSVSLVMHCVCQRRFEINDAMCYYYDVAWHKRNKICWNDNQTFDEMWKTTIRKLWYTWYFGLRLTFIVLLY